MRFAMIAGMLACVSAAFAQDLKAGFQNPPQEARPRVWWHWMNGNITKDGIRKDIEWMHRAGIGGYHNFDAGMATRQVVEQRLTYMSPGWKDAFRYAVKMADSLGMEVATASCPGWSNTGGPWVKPEQAMKRLVWSEVGVKGGRQANVVLPQPEHRTWYKDLYAIAVRRNKADKTMEELGATPIQGDGWMGYRLKQPVTIKALSIVDGQTRGIWAAAPAPVTKYLEVSDDGKSYRRVCGIPHGSVRRQTIEIPPTKGRYFRVVCEQPDTKVTELTLHSVARINHAEEKAGFATPSDLMDHPTTASDDEVVTMDDVIDLTALMDAEGRLQWEAPRGDWRVYRFGYTLTGKENHPASPEATGLEVTKLDKEAFTAFLEYYLDMYKETLPAELMGQRGLQYLLIDSYEAGWETWAPKMPEEFERRRGYSLLKWLPVLTGQIIGSAERSEQFLFDWRTTIGELIEECMYANADRIAKQYGLGTYFESHENGRLYLVDGMAAKSKADIPMAAMWTMVPGKKAANSSTTMAESDIRESASVAHLYGKKIVAAESLTANGQVGAAYAYYPGNLKATADLEMACGVNRFVIHESSHQPVDDKKPGLGLGIYGQWFNRHETWAEQAKAWTDYLARSCYLLQQGRNVADILYYYGEDDVVTSLFAHQHPQIPYGYNYDYLNKEALLDLIAWDGEHFVTPSGSQYRVLIIDGKCQHVSADVARKLESFRTKGAPVFDLRTQQISEALRRVAPDFKAGDGGDWRYVHRRTSNGDIYWVNNRSDEARSVDASFRITGLKPALWHPETGLTEEVTYEIGEDETVVHLNMTAGEAVFVVFREKAGQAKQTVPDLQETLLQRLDTPWTVQFDEVWGGPKEIVFDSLISYTDSENPGIKYYSGTAVYKNSFKLTETELKQGQLVLDLGKVGCMAEVTVNGRNLGVLWRAPYTVDITEALKAGRNELEIRVVNLWVNRIIGDLQPGCEKRYTYPAAQFYRADSELLPSGLMGPVVIKLVQPKP